MNHRCPSCYRPRTSEDQACSQCGTLIESRPANSARRHGRLFSRVAVCIGVCFLAVLIFYLSLIATSKPLQMDQRAIVSQNARLIRDAGFTSEARMLETIAVFRASDNWLNAATPKENAFAATNFPFAILTIYPDYFTYPIDDVERAAILLHEARHISGGDEKDAYKFVWLNRHKLGWTRDKYANSPVWRNVRKQTREFVPELFTCPGNDLDDCTEF